MISFKNIFFLFLFFKQGDKLLIQAATLVVRYSQVFVGSYAFVHLNKDQMAGFEDMMINFIQKVDDNTSVQTDFILNSQGPRRIRRQRPRHPKKKRRRRPRAPRPRTSTKAGPGRNLASNNKPKASSSESNKNKEKETTLSDYYKESTSVRGIFKNVQTLMFLLVSHFILP